MRKTVILLKKIKLLQYFNDHFIKLENKKTIQLCDMTQLKKNSEVTSIQNKSCFMQCFFLEADLTEQICKSNINQ